jgi:hypothetical protein
MIVIVFHSSSHKTMTLGQLPQSSHASSCTKMRKMWPKRTIKLGGGCRGTPEIYPIKVSGLYLMCSKDMVFSPSTVGL